MSPALKRFFREHGRAAAIIGSAGLLGLGMWSYYAPGYFQDDAVYWMVSRSLLEGRYTVPSDPLAEPVLYLPGYPLFLAATTAGASFGLAKFWSWVLTLGALAGAWRFFRRRLPRETALWALGCLAGLPLLLRFSSTCMSEPLFVCVAVWAFCLYDELRERPFSRADLAPALLVGYACWVRTSGPLLAAALAGDALLNRRWKRAGWLAGCAVLFQGSLSLWRHAQGETVNIFANVWRFVLGEASPRRLLSVAVANAASYAESVPFGVFFPGSEGVLNGLGLSWIRAAVLAGFWALLAAGIVKSLRSDGRPLVFFSFLQAGLILTWMRPDSRYLLPLLFPLTAFLFKTLEAHPRAMRAVALSAIVLCLGADVQSARQAWNSPHAPPVRTFRWLNGVLPRDAVLGSTLPHTYYFYEGRRGRSFPLTYDPEQFLSFLLDGRVTHILIDEHETAPRPDANHVGALARMMARQPGRYGKIAEEGRFSLYAVDVDTAAFRKAYDYYLRGAEAADAGRAEEARDLLNDALSLRPDMTTAHDWLCRMAAQSGDLAEARAHIARALALWPSMPLLRYHSYLLRNAAGEKAAEEDLKAAQEGAVLHGHWYLLWEMERSGHAPRRGNSAAPERRTRRPAQPAVFSKIRPEASTS
ncbi:MAG: hypothetical protein ACT4O3_09400 [Elusimicrobiota bacterium]